MNAAEERAEAPGKEKVHEEEATLVLDKRDLHFGIGNGGAPRVLTGFAQGEGAQFRAAEQPDGRTKKDSAGPDQNEEQGAGVSNWRTPKLH